MDKKLKIASISIIALLALIIGLALFVDTSPKSITTNRKAGPSITNNDNSNDHKAALAQATPSNQPVYKIFFENSGSMNGYVCMECTRIKDAVRELVRRIEGHNLSDNIKLFWLNSIVEQRNNDLNDFIKNLTQEAFQQESRGNRSETDIAARFKLLLENIQDNEVGIMISDCLLLPNIPAGLTIKHLLTENSIEIYGHFNAKLKERNFSTLVLQVFADFNGPYYDFQNPMSPAQQNITNRDRPYYIWIFGKPGHISKFNEHLPNFSAIQRNLRNSHHFALYDSDGLPYRVLIAPKIGSFTLDLNNPRTQINNARAESIGNLQGVFEFAVGVDFSSFPMGEEYFTNPDNYELTPGYSIRIEENNSPNLTHTLRLRTNTLQTETVEIKLKNQVPDWVEEYNLYDDTNINSPDQIEKTFGIKYIFKGVHEGYLTHADYNEHFFNIQIHVNQ